MENSHSLEELKEMTEEKIVLGDSLINKLSSIEHIDGVKKVQRKILQELKFLRKIKAANTVKLHHLQCSNLTYYSFLVKNIFTCENLKHVEYPLHVANRADPLKIDIVCDNGTTWIKVIAKNSKTINNEVHGRSEYGSKSILDQAEEFVEAALENPCFFKPPKIVFKFACQIDEDLVEELFEIGVHVTQQADESVREKCDNEDDSQLYLVDKLNNKFDLEKDITILNLDVSTLLAYVSSLTNGGGKCTFKEPLLNDQALCEQRKSVKLTLDQLFQGKRLICCQTAVNSFKNIVSMLAGPKESIRAQELLDKVEILPDVNTIDDSLSHINVSGKIKERSLIIFSFGLHHKALTVTSNEGFIRSIKMQGQDIPAFVHEARALTEIKEV